MKRKLLADHKTARRITKKGNFLNPLVAHVEFFAQDLSHVGYFNLYALLLPHEVGDLGRPPQVSLVVYELLHCLNNSGMLLELIVFRSLNLT